MSVPSSAEGSLLRAAQGGTAVALAELSPPGGLLLVMPHPDDETLGCGQALAAAADAGRPIGLVLVTDGEASHPSCDRGELVAMRRTELAAALAVLSPGRRIPVHRLALPDGTSRRGDLSGEGWEALLAFANTLDPRAIWTTSPIDPHCDHAAAHAIARDIAEHFRAALWSAPVWGRFGERPLPEGELRLFEAPALAERKARALAAYRSQFTDLIADPEAFLMPEPLLAHFAAHPGIFHRG
ncbi:MAG: PIG-L family deacetylase [Alphaproteobacteria bacterium]|nr:PIG-L family deacetylase [Alphaproteobacteria bacterium]